MFASNEILQFVMIAVNGIFLICAHATVVAANDGKTLEGSAVFGDFINRVWGDQPLQVMDFIFLGCAVILGLEILNRLVANSGYLLNMKLIPVRGKHLDELRPKDKLFIAINKAQTAPFVYFLFLYLHKEPNVDWDVGSLTINTFFTKGVLPLIPIFIIYDFFYTILHWFLHIKAIYGYIHKHHHIQKAPSRANVDAVNVHPLEFFLGEYDHLLAVYLYCHVCNMQFHVLGAVLFLIVGGSCAGLNHTRFDTVFQIMGIKLYDSKYHDVHHRIPQSNYGQYIMLWDHVFGTFRDYNENDRVNPKSQLDKKTGKSLEYIENLKSRQL